jgi:hypothetical protein
MASLMAGIAPTFSTSTSYPVGAYVYYNGTLYRFTAAHAAGSWTGTDATAVALGNDVADLKTSNGIQDERTNQLLGLMNYGYDTPADLAAGTSASTIVSVKRVGTEILLNGNPTSYQFVAKINNDVQRAATSSQVNALTNGTIFQSGHTYRITLKYISGSGTYNNASYIPWISVYKSGTSTTVGTEITSTETEYCREFTADGSTYMVCVYCHKGANLSNMFVSVTMQDMADKSIYEMIDSLTVVEGSAWE